MTYSELILILVRKFTCQTTWTFNPAMRREAKVRACPYVA